MFIVRKTMLVGFAAVLLCTQAAQAKEKRAAPSRNGLAEYIQRVSGKALEVAPSTQGSLWNDSGTAGQHGDLTTRFPRWRSGYDRSGAESFRVQHGQRFHEPQLLREFSESPRCPGS